MTTAVLVDAAFFLKRVKKLYPDKDHNNANVIADLLHRYALLHLKQGQDRKKLYRIFVYDCPPLDVKRHNPISGKLIDYSKSETAIFRRAFHENLKRKRLLALRLGEVRETKDWCITPKNMKKFLKKEISADDLSEDDVFPVFRQKGVDIKIGVDISSLSYKRQVDQIVLIAGDSDFVPAAKLARREGVDFILDPMWNDVSPDLFEHIDGLRSVCKPLPRSGNIV